MKILIIRHGDPDYVNDTITERGKKEVELLTQRLCKLVIKKAYLSPMGRAQDTARPYLEAKKVPFETCDFLKEFMHPVTLPKVGAQSVPWDIMPSFYASDKKLLNKDEWFNNSVMKAADFYGDFLEVCEGFDKILAGHGYERDGINYKAIKPNTDTFAFFCHFGVEGVILSHLCNCAPHIIWQSFVALPTSVTTVITEEREKGVASFRCCGFGDCSHLYGKIEPSFAGRFCETFDSIEGQ